MRRTRLALAAAGVLAAAGCSGGGDSGGAVTVTVTSTRTPAATTSSAPPTTAAPSATAIATAPRTTTSASRPDAIRSFDLGEATWQDERFGGRVQLRGGRGHHTGTDGFDVRATLTRDHLHYVDLDGDGFEDVTAQLMTEEGNGYGAYVYVWRWDPARGTAEQLLPPVTDDARCGNVTQSLTVVGREIHVVWRDRTGFEGPCAAEPTAVRSSVVTVRDGRVRRTDHEVGPTGTPPGPVDRSLRGAQFGTASTLGRQGARWVLTFDKAYFCRSGDRTNDSGCGPDRPDTPDGYWVVDENHRLRAVAVADSAAVSLVGQDANSRPGTLEELAAKVRPGGRVLLHLRMDDAGTVVAITEQFVP